MDDHFFRCEGVLLGGVAVRRGVEVRVKVGEVCGFGAAAAAAREASRTAWRSLPSAMSPAIVPWSVMWEE